jgi:uncharacterized protein involved in exopolysaccharide biosynthesis
MRDFGNSSNDNWDHRSEESENSAQIPDFLKDPLGILERRWPVMLAAVVLGLVATVYVVAQAKLTYVSQASVLVTRQQIPEKYVNSTVAEDSIANINAMVGKVLSQDNLAKLIERFDLYKSHRELVSMSELANRMKAGIAVTPQRSFTQKSRGESSVIYTISFENKDSEVAADVANALAGLLQEASIERRTEQARAATSFLQRQLEDDEREFREVSQGVSEFRKTHRGSLPDELQTNLRKLELLGSRRESLVTQISSGENRLMSVGSGTIAMQLAELRAQLSKESAMYTDEHPNVAALRYQIRRLEQSLASQQPGSLRPEFGGVLASGNSEIEMLRAQIRRIDLDISDLNARIDSTPAVSEELVAMEQKESVLRENYLSSLNKVEEAELAESMEHAQQGAQVQILDPAMPSSTPKRSRRLLAFVGLIATLVLAIAMAITIEIFDPVIVAAEQLERIVGRPVLGSLPRLV